VWCFAVFCSVLQCVAVCCSVSTTHSSVPATHTCPFMMGICLHAYCNTLQDVERRCKTLQRAAMHCDITCNSSIDASIELNDAKQYTVTHCNKMQQLQHATTRCITPRGSSTDASIGFDNEEQAIGQSESLNRQRRQHQLVQFRTREWTDGKGKNEREKAHW